MTVLTALARAAAATAGRALPTKTVRHVHLSARPLVLVAAQLAGEACAPLAVLVGDDRDKPRLLVVYEPRDRTQRFEFAADLAAIVLPYIDGYTDDPADDPTGPADKAERSEPYLDAPQLLVPNQPTAAFLRLLGRSTRFRGTEGAYAVAASVPLLGRWLTYFAERGEVSPSAQLLAMTAALADHWATGQSAAEDANLAALLGWIDPPDGMNGHDAARAAEDPLRFPPAGPVTDPIFDNEVLSPILQEMREATLTSDGGRLGRARADMDRGCAPSLSPPGGSCGEPSTCSAACPWPPTWSSGGCRTAGRSRARSRGSAMAAPRRPAGTARSRRPGGWSGLSASSSGWRWSAPTTIPSSWPSTG